MILNQNPQHKSSVPIPHEKSWVWKLLAFSGPAYLIAVGYMDPGNWATDLAGGSQFGYSLLFVVLASSLSAMLLQYLCAKLGIVTGRDLAELSRDHFPVPVTIFLWIMAEVMIIACDLAEVIGSAIALYLLFHIPLLWGVLITAADVLLLLALVRHGFRTLEAIVFVLIATVVACFGIDLLVAQPALAPLFAGFIPTGSILLNHDMLYIAIGIIGATVMPHNLYLHSSVVQTRRYKESPEGKREAIRFSGIDSVIALSLAFFVNAAILVLAASVFNAHGYTHVTDLTEAYKLLVPLLGGSFAAILFGLALLASGQNSTITGTLAGQVIMEGFLGLKLPPALRRILTRGLALIPAVACILIFGAGSLPKLLILSQVILSIQLPFALVPLLYFTSRRSLMGEFVNKMWTSIIAGIITVVISGLSVFLLFGLVA